MTKCLTPSHHTHIHPIQPPNPHPFIPLHSQTQTPCLLPIPQHSPPLSFCTLCACHTATTTHHLIVEEERKKEGLRVRGRKGVAHLSGFFEVTQNHSTLLINHPHRETKREKRKRLLRPYQEESTTSRLISEVKPVRAWLVQSTFL